jgi:uncharacterized membrane protein YjjP (DUF1212 family)
VDFILHLGTALHRFAMPAHRLEEALMAVSRKLGCEARFYSTPTSMIASFGPERELRAAMLRMPPGEMDLEKLVELDTLADEVIAGHLPPEAGSERIEQILSAPPRYGKGITLLAFFFTGLAAARLFGGAWRESLVAGVISLLIGVLDRLARRIGGLARVLEPVAALLAAVLASLGAAFLQPMSAKVATLGGLFILLPGLTLTVSLIELSTRNLVSGTSRLTGALLVFLQLGFGVALGSQVAKFLPRATLPVPVTPGVEDLLALALVSAALVVWLRARPKDLGSIALVSAAGYVGARLGVALLGPELGPFVGALLVGMSSNLLARLRNKPAMVTIVPALLVLVPGSVGFASLQSLLARDVLGGIGTAFSMLLAAVSLCAGLLFSHALVPPRRSL